MRFCRPILGFALPLALFSLAGCGGSGMVTQPPISVSLPVSKVTLTQNGNTVIIPIQIMSTSETALVMVNNLPSGVQSMYAASDTNPSGTLSFKASSSTMTGTFMPTVNVLSAGQSTSTQFTLVVTMQ